MMDVRKMGECSDAELKELEEMLRNLARYVALERRFRYFSKLGAMGAAEIKWARIDQKRLRETLDEQLPWMKEMADSGE